MEESEGSLTLHTVAILMQNNISAPTKYMPPAYYTLFLLIELTKPHSIY
jgi:hypothetical protein